MERTRPRKISFAVPRKGAGLVWIVLALVCSLTLYVSRFTGPYRVNGVVSMCMTCIWLFVGPLLLIPMLIYALRHKCPTPLLVLVGTYMLALCLPVQREPEKAWFLKHQAGYEQVLQLAQSDEWSQNPDHWVGCAWAVPADYHYLRLESVCIEQYSPLLIEFRSRLFDTSVWYFETANESPFRYWYVPFYAGEEQLAEHWWLVYQDPS